MILFDISINTFGKNPKKDVSQVQEILGGDAETSHSYARVCPMRKHNEIERKTRSRPACMPQVNF